MKKETKILLILILVFFAINYPFLDSFLERSFSEEGDFGFVERIIDGDTIVINGTSIRLLGINTPEKSEKYYQEAKEFLEKIVLNKSVELRFGKDKYDKYDRLLAYIFYKGKDVNLELVDEGYANFYFPSGKDSYYDEFVRAWEHCIEENKYLCEKSEENCIELKSFDYKKEIIILGNKCSNEINLEGWEIKDEGRKKFYFKDFVLSAGGEVKIITGDGEDNNEELFWSGQKYVWTKTGDTLFLRDKEGKLVLWESY